MSLHSGLIAFIRYRKERKLRRKRSRNLRESPAVVVFVSVLQFIILYAVAIADAVSPENSCPVS